MMVVVDEQKKENVTLTLVDSTVKISNFGGYGTSTLRITPIDSTYCIVCGQWSVGNGQTFKRQMTKTRGRTPSEINRKAGGADMH